jgi:hypothetical protein
MELISLKDFFDFPVARSQAKRIIRESKNKEILLDFTSIEICGNSFIDEIFRVNKDKIIKYANANNYIKSQIEIKKKEKI